MSSIAMIEHIARWRSTVPHFDYAGLLPWTMERHRVGWVTPELAKRMLASEWFVAGKDGPALRDDIGGPISKTQALSEFAYDLREEGWIQAWRDEQFDYVDDWGRIWFSLERGAFRPLGLRSRAVHINGYVGDEALWVARRAETKRVDPGKLDNFVAGGITRFEAPKECLVRELAEEAGVPRMLALQALPEGVMHSLRREPDGLHDELLFCYDLRLPDSFAPVNCDGEVASFTLMGVTEVAERLGEMTLDAAAVTVAWLHRWLDGEV